MSSAAATAEAAETSAAPPRQDYLDGESLKTLPQVLSAMFRFGAPRMLAAAALCSLVARPFFAVPDLVDAIVVAAIVVYWPFQEWLVHIRVLHVNPNDPRQRRFDTAFAKCHRLHHRDPRDVKLILLPSWLMRVVIPLNAALWFGLADTPGHALTGIACLSVMNLIYEWTHLVVHTGYKPRSAFAKRVRRNHRLHHYRNERYWMAFVLPHVDALLGTDPDPRAIEYSKTARDLHGLHEAGLE